MNKTQIIFVVPIRKPLFYLILIAPLMKGGETFCHAGAVGAAIIEFEAGYFVQWRGAMCAVRRDEEGQVWQKVTGVPKAGAVC